MIFIEGLLGLEVCILIIVFFLSFLDKVKATTSRSMNMHTIPFRQNQMINLKLFDVYFHNIIDCKEILLALNVFQVSDLRDFVNAAWMLLDALTISDILIIRTVVDCTILR